MKRGWQRGLLRLGLFAALAGLLVFIWVTDRPSPAYPHGRFGELVLLGLLAAGLAGVLLLALRKPDE